jgi:hypothetical protein
VSAGTLSIVGGDNQNGPAGSALPNPLEVRLVNAASNPLPGITVNFTVASGNASVSPASVVSDNDGRASVTLTLGATPGTALVAASAQGFDTAQFTANILPTDNPILLENQNPGTTAWQINLPVTEGAPEIAGYAGVTSILPGENLPLRITLAQPGQYTVNVYRLGWYGGAGGRLMHSSGSQAGGTQPPCNEVNATTLLIECNWSISYTVPTTGNWVTGIYVANLTAQASGRQSQVWFVVRDDASTAEILFQSSFTTFLAYNNYGDATQRSLYPHSSTNGQRALAVSFNRPFSQVAGTRNIFEHLFEWEYPMLRWLESQGYDLTYATNMDVHENPNQLLQHRVFLSVGHDE